MMKKTITLLALAIVAGVSCSEAIAKDKKKKAQQVEVQAPQKEIVSLSSKSDSVSYAAGQSYTNGMMPYVVQQLKLDTTYMADFVQGLKEALEAENTPQAKAKAAGQQIAGMVNNNMLPSLREQLNGTAAELNDAMFKRGFIDAVTNDASVLSMEEAQKYMETQMKALHEQKVEAQKAEGKAWLDENAKKEGVIVLPSGLQYKVLTQGNGPVATKDQEVVVKYEGKLINGKVFDSSYTRNPQTTTFKPSGVIPGWTEALCMMPQGSAWELYIPYDLAYGERGAGADIPPYATLIFKVEVIEVKPMKAEEPIDTKENTPAAKKVSAAKKVTKPATKKASVKK